MHARIYDTKVKTTRTTAGRDRARTYGHQSRRHDSHYGRTMFVGNQRGINSQIDELSQLGQYQNDMEHNRKRESTGRTVKACMTISTEDENYHFLKDSAQYFHAIICFNFSSGNHLTAKKHSIVTVSVRTDGKKRRDGRRGKNFLPIAWPVSQRVEFEKRPS